MKPETILLSFKLINTSGWTIQKKINLVCVF